ncbi:Uncharacterised protein [Bordetella pertussis]|nr:Uncharacterised protein [Bordetella pertussis]CFW34464.1 Uncharacterised protein [Bordetella pertussis]CPN47688.1 Uncharacterised protein [Bordetella pertussis]
MRSSISSRNSTEDEARLPKNSVKRLRGSADRADFTSENTGVMPLPTANAT